MVAEDGILTFLPSCATTSLTYRSIRGLEVRLQLLRVQCLVRSSCALSRPSRDQFAPQGGLSQ